MSAVAAGVDAGCVAGPTRCRLYVDRLPGDGLERSQEFDYGSSAAGTDVDALVPLVPIGRNDVIEPLDGVDVRPCEIPDVDVVADG
jgi:hypothetical protein